jgi:hypothetical protein
MDLYDSLPGSHESVTGSFPDTNHVHLLLPVSKALCYIS